MKFGRTVKLVQMPHAEKDIAVAGASILARDKFLEWFDSANERFSFRFPKGASEEVVATAREFVTKFGASKLEEVAKLHFRTTKEVLGSSEVSA
jgi:ribonuclease HIII